MRVFWFMCLTAASIIGSIFVYFLFIFVFRAQSNRGMVYGRYLDVSGDQVMTVMQEVSVRPRRKK